MSPIFIILCSVIGLTSGVGVLPDSMNSIVGRTVTFTTSLAPAETPFVTIKWSFKGANIITHSASSTETDPKYEGRITLFPSTGSLALSKLTLNDAGDYIVTITPAGGGAPETGSTTLNVYERVSNVKVTATSRDLVEFNDTVTLSCSASGSALSFRWLNGSAELTASDRVRFTDGGATVTFDPVLRYDAYQLYNCNVSNPASTMTVSIWFSVYYGPYSINLEETEHHLSGSPAFILCKTESRPRPQYRWFFNELQLLNTESSLYLKNLQTNQTGNYSCDTFNSKTLRYVRSNLVPISVWDEIKNASVTPSHKPVEGSPLNLTCDASGSIVTREWTTSGEEIKPSENIEFFDEKRVLSFKKLTSNDDRFYSCKISNPVSSRYCYYSVSLFKGGLAAAEIALITAMSIVAVAGVAIGGFFLYKQNK